jgi:hypothetical protein
MEQIGLYLLVMSPKATYENRGGKAQIIRDVFANVYDPKS